MAAAFPCTSITLVSCGRVKESWAPFNLALQRPLAYSEPCRHFHEIFLGGYFFKTLTFQWTNIKMEMSPTWLLKQSLGRIFLKKVSGGTAHRYRQWQKNFLRPNPGKNHLKWMWFVDSKLAQISREMPVFVFVCNFSKLVKLSTMVRIFTRFKIWFKQFLSSIWLSKWKRVKF